MRQHDTIYGVGPFEQLTDRLASGEDGDGVTRAQIAQLWALQQVDGEIERASAEEDALRASLAADAAQGARASLAQAERAVEVRSQREHQAEAVLDETRRRLQQQESRLYGGAVPAKDLSKLLSLIHI